MVVDDDNSILTIFEFILQQAGYRTVTVSSGEECIKQLAAGIKVDLLFLDLRMNGLSGVETLIEIKKIDPMLLTILMTGYSVDESLMAGFELGAYGVIYKPFNVEEIMSVIDKFFKLPGFAPTGNK